jgi:hypothetical protein
MLDRRGHGGVSGHEFVKARTRGHDEHCEAGLKAMYQSTSRLIVMTEPGSRRHLEEFSRSLEQREKFEVEYLLWRTKRIPDVADEALKLLSFKQAVTEDDLVALATLACIFLQRPDARSGCM